MSLPKKHPCDCQTGNRTLILLAKDFEEKYPELVFFGNTEDWTYLADFGVVQVEIGANRQWTGTIDVFNFLRTVIFDQGRLSEISAGWLKNRQPLASQIVQLIYEAVPITDFAPEGSSELLEMFEQRRIETWFQPVVEARGEKIWGYECLMRGRKTDGSLVGAPQLLEWARAENLIFMLDRVCRETHLENAGRLGLDSDVKFLINFLPTAIYQPQFCLQTSLAAMRKSGLMPSQIIFEVVESEKVADHEHLRKILEFYRQSGFGVALDDLGSGYAGLSLLGDLQPDLIKIDREIVAKSTGSKFHRDICASLIKLGKDNGQIVLAEGVETAEEKALMNQLGVDLFQGYFFGKPAPQPMTQYQLQNSFAIQNLQTV